MATTANLQSDERLTYQAPALERGLEIFECLADAGTPITLAEIGRQLGRSRSELFRMCVVLERCGYIVRTADDRYALTAKLYDVALRAPPQRDLLDAALPVMHRLAVRLQQACHLGIASGPDMVVAARVESPDMLGFSLRVGFRRPLNLSASGRVLYSFQTPAIRETWRALSQGPDDEQRWHAERVIEFLRLHPWRHALVGKLSYGLQKRVELARALAAEPRMLLLDEPMAGMNAKEKHEMSQFIRDINRELGTTVVLIEHDIGVVMGLCDHVVVLDYGRKIGDGTPDQVRSNPDVIAAYLGTRRSQSARSQ